MPALSNKWNISNIHLTNVVILLLGDSTFDADALQVVNKRIITLGIEDIAKYCRSSKF
jgi:hypothetical protein